jgi:hypothetical protein
MAIKRIGKLLFSKTHLAKTKKLENNYRNVLSYEIQEFADCIYERSET